MAIQRTIVALPAATGRAARPHKPASWQVAMQEAVRSVAELCRLLELPPRSIDEAAGAHRDFPLFVPRGYVARMKKGDPHDPLLRQVLPLDE